MNEELKTHLIETIENNYTMEDTDFSELHYHAFNEDYYLIGYYQAEQWLKQHDVSAWDAIETVRDYEVNNFGEFTTPINSERIVNMYVYIKGEELMNALGCDLNDVSYNELMELLK